MQRQLHLSPYDTAISPSAGLGDSASRWADQGRSDGDPTEAAAPDPSSRRLTSGGRPRPRPADKDLPLGMGDGTTESGGGFHGRGLTVESAPRRCVSAGLTDTWGACTAGANQRRRPAAHYLSKVLLSLPLPLSLSQSLCTPTTHSDSDNCFRPSGSGALANRPHPHRTPPVVCRVAPGGLDPQAAAALRDENRALKREVQQLREVLQAVHVQHPAGEGAGVGGSGIRGAAGGGSPYERLQQQKGAGVGGGSTAMMQAELSSTRRYKAQVVQLHRQVALLSEELQVWA